jgi:hypothetical protein
VKRRFTANNLAAVGVSLLLAAFVSLVYYAFFSSEFTPVRVNVVDAEQTASRHLVSVTLPDLSALHGQTTVLAFRLRNGGGDPKRIGLLRDGLPPHRVVVPPDDTIDWNVVLTPELVQALDIPSPDGSRRLELTADADVWGLMSLDIRNYHLHWGDRASVSVLPTGNGGYTIRLSPLALFVVASALLIPVVSYALRSRAIAARTRSVVAIVPRVWTRHEVTLERVAALLGLVAIAIAQPVFEVVANSPEFFPARSTPPVTIVAAVLAICVGLPLVLLAIERAIRTMSRPAATVFHGGAIALMVAAIVMPWFRRRGVPGFPWDASISALIGVGVAVIYSRARGVRQFLTALAPAALVVPILFLLDPGVKQSFTASESAAALDTLERTPPIVIVVFDELPMNSFLDASGNIDADRYPHVGALAREAYWFRNASTVSYTTSYAVPAIVSGRYSKTDKAVPTLRYYPVNLFTALARHYSIFASMRFQQLCPPRACQQNEAVAADSAQSLVSDLGLVWLHIVLPEKLTEQLPPVVGDWMEFGRTREVPAAKGTRAGRGGVFAQFVSTIDDRDARLHFIHLVLPHMPLEYVSSGRRYRGPDYQTTMYRGRGLFEGVSAAYADTLHQRHLAQVGFTDRLVGDLVARLRETGVYDKAMVIVTADHGASYREGRHRRQPRPQQQNVSDIIQVPLIMKLPGQRQGEVVDRIVETVDIFPTILDVLGAKASLRLDGRSLLGAQASQRPRESFFLYNRVDRPPVAVGDLVADRQASLERKEQRFGRGDLMALYAPAGARHVLGMNVSGAALRPAADVKIALRNPTQFDAVKRGTDPLPLYVHGALRTSRSDPLTVAVAVNGIVAAVTQSYQERDGHMFGTLIPETVLRDGRNTVSAFVVDRLPPAP